MCKKVIADFDILFLFSSFEHIFQEYAVFHIYAVQIDERCEDDGITNETCSL